MNSIPAFSSAILTAATLLAIPGAALVLASILLKVGIETFEARASSS